MTDTTGGDAVKQSRTIMRRIDDHLRRSHLHLGAQEESAGFVDVIHHETSPLGCLNYVTPRRSTAWVSGKHVEAGLERLAGRDRPRRVRYIEGLFPPVFARSLRELDLQPEEETPIMAYVPGGTPFTPPAPPDGVQLTRVSDANGMGLWWYVWRNAYYEIFTDGAEPILLGRSLSDLYRGHHIDLVMYHYGFPIGAARVTLGEGTAHLLAQAVLREVRTPELKQALRGAALKAALENGADLVFTSGESEEERAACRDLGFVDSGSIVCYAGPEVLTTSGEESNGTTLAQPVLIL